MYVALGNIQGGQMSNGWTYLKHFCLPMAHLTVLTQGNVSEIVIDIPSHSNKLSCIITTIQYSVVLTLMELRSENYYLNTWNPPPP